MGDASQPVVLVVEDEPDVAETYQIWLSGEYDVRTAASGQEALDVIDDTVEVVLLDRMMPGMSGDEVLTEIRDREIDVRVAMVTAVDPDFDVIEMGFDDYVTKPPTKEGLVDTVEELLDREDYTERMEKYQSLLAKRTAIRTEKGTNELADSEEYDDLEAEIERLDRDLHDEDDERLNDDAEFVGALRELTGESEEDWGGDGAELDWKPDETSDRDGGGDE